MTGEGFPGDSDGKESAGNVGDLVSIPGLERAPGEGDLCIHPGCKVKRALGSITMNKGSGGDGIPAELFQILKDDAAKVLHSICQQIWKTQQWPRDWKRSVFIPVSKKGNAKE